MPAKAKTISTHPYQLRNADFKSSIQTLKFGGFNADYLSWSICWDNLKAIYPKARYEWITYDYDNKPYGGIMSPDGTVTIHARIIYGAHEYHDEYLAVRDNRNKAISNPDSAQMENTFRRAIAKGVSTLTGYGIALWTGEDIAEIENYRPEVLLGTTKRYTKGMITVDQTIKLDELRRTATINPSDKARVTSLKKNDWQGITEEQATVLIADIKVGVKNNKPITNARKLKVIDMINDSKLDDDQKNTSIAWLDGKNNGQVDSFLLKLNKGNANGI